MYSVKQLADLAGVSRKTLHHYDKIGLLKPERQIDNQYRYYQTSQLLLLQQILFYKELGFSLRQIRQLLSAKEFDLSQSLRQQRQVLEQERKRYGRLITTINQTLNYLEGKQKMSDQALFEGLTEQKQTEYEREALNQYDAQLVKESNQRWKNYSKLKQQEILTEGEQIYREFALHIDLVPESVQVQTLVKRWHDHLCYYYQPTITMLSDLGELYVADERFAANFRKLNPKLPEYLQKAIEVYCDQRTGPSSGQGGN